MIRLLYGLKISDLGPFRAARAEVLRALELEEATYGWAVEMILKGAIAGFRIIEVPVSYHPRIGKSKISGTLKGTLGAAWLILSRIVRYYFQRRKAPGGSSLVTNVLWNPTTRHSCVPAKHNRTLVIMAKAPGRERSRPDSIRAFLRLTVIALYRCLLQDTLALAHSLTDVDVAVMCPESDKGDLAHFLGNVVPVVAQKGEGLAAGLVSVFAHFTAAGIQRVIAFNSDSPHLRAFDSRERFSGALRSRSGNGADTRRRLLSCRRKGCLPNALRKRRPGNKQRA